MKLIFVYNAKSDRVSKMLDFAHKIVSPKTYACDLCSLTHGNFKEKDEWSAFMDKIDTEIDFHHIEDFEQKYHIKGDYPIIYVYRQSKLSVMLDKAQISQFKSVNELIFELENQLSTYN